MLILVIVLFLFCWGSRLCMEISIKVGLESFSQGIYILRIAINLLPYVHSCLNPFIYSLMSKNFRRSMWRRLHCCCCFCTSNYCCVRRRCFCNSASNSSTAATGAVTDPSGEHRRQCRHCSQFSSHYNLNEMSVGTGTSVNGPEARAEGYRLDPLTNGSTSRMRGLTTRLTIATGALGGTSPLLMRTRNTTNRSVYSTSVIPECTDHSEVDCCL